MSAPSASPPSFADVLAIWAEQEQGTEQYSHARLPIDTVDPGLPLTLQNLYIGDMFCGSDPEIFFYCVDEKGCSVQVRIKNFHHYFFYPAPALIETTDVIPLRDHVNNLLNENPDISVVSPVKDIQLVERKLDIDDEQTVQFLQIFVHLDEVKNVQDKSKLGSLQYRNLFTVPNVSFDGGLPYIWRFLHDHQIEPMGWIEIPANQYNVVPVNERISRSQLEVSINPDVLYPVTSSQFAPLRIFSFDIETDISANGSFPIADINHVIQIGCMLSVHGTYGQTVPQVRKIFTLNTCTRIAGAQVHSFVTELDMLRAWRQFFIETDPDIVTGYNISQFDIPFLLKRALILGLNDFSDLGRIIGIPQDLPESRPDFYNCADFEGRLLIDMMHQMELLTGRWLKLDLAATHFLGEKKEYMNPMDIPVLQRGGPDERRKLAVYCLKDTYLPLQLMSRQQTLEKYTERAKAARLPMNMMRSPQRDLDRLSQCIKESTKAVEDNCVIPPRLLG